MSPLVALLLAVALVIVGIAVLRVHAFIVLLFAACFVGIVAAPEGTVGAAAAIDQAMREFGNSVGQIGFVIALAAMIGVFLMESGAAERMVRWLLAVCGESRTPLALMLAGFILSVPVFFDTVFFLLVPLVRALCQRTGKNYLFYVLSICCGGVITHSLVPPTPGPLLAATTLKLDIGIVMVAGLLASLPVSLAGLALARWLGQRLNIPLREATGVTLAELRAQSERPENQLPGLIVSMAPIVLPVLLIGLGTGLKLLPAVKGSSFWPLIEFLGNKNVALFLGAIAAGALWFVRQPDVQRNLAKRLQAPLETAGVIILITGAGGAFGAMVKHAGVGPQLQALAESWGIGPIVLAWGLTWLIRAALGSATVAMFTAAGLMAAMLSSGVTLPYHPIYIFLAIGFGSKSFSWMNDSGFWIMGRMSGLTEGETLRSWSVLLAAMSVFGLIEVLILSRLLPFAG